MYAGVLAGLGEFVENSDGMPEAEVVERDGGNGTIPLFTIEAMQWIDLCIGMCALPRYCGHCCVRCWIHFVCHVVCKPSGGNAAIVCK